MFDRSMRRGRYISAIGARRYWRHKTTWQGDDMIAIDDASTWVTMAQLVGLAVFGWVATLWLAGVFWVASDARQRLRDPLWQWGAVAVAALLFVPGILLYLALRPKETFEEREERRIEIEALAQQVYERQACARCRRVIREDFIRCPYCAASVGERCTSCSRSLSQGWVICPYCGERPTSSEPEEVPAFAARPGAARAGLRRRFAFSSTDGRGAVAR
jgi:RNA polymerase subunit RPABC4/transcription elongation factor Spt4